MSINTDRVQVISHSCVRIDCGKIVYVDPFELTQETHDADVILVTHDHFDHYSPEDIAHIIKDDTIIAAPKSMIETAEKDWGASHEIIAVDPGDIITPYGITVEVVHSYNVGKQFHPKANNWVGYIVIYDGVRYYIAGDCDINDDNLNVRCDVALIPVGGTYTMTAAEAAKLVNAIKPKVAIPTHYGTAVGEKTAGQEFISLIDDGIETELKLKFD